MREEAEAQGDMVPDGIVPAALRRFLEGVGVLRSEAVDAAAGVVNALCEAVQWASLARARAILFS